MEEETTEQRDRPKDRTPPRPIKKPRNAVLLIDGKIDDEPKLNIERTFQEMQYRRWRRVVGGKYKNRHSGRNCWLFLFIVTFLGMGALSLDYNSVEEHIAVQYSLPLATSFYGGLGPFFYLLTILVVLYAVYKVMSTVRWCLYWLALCVCMLTFVTKRPPHKISLFGLQCPDNTEPDPTCFALSPCRSPTLGSCLDAVHNDEEPFIVIAFLVLEVCTIGIWLYRRYLFPRLLKASWYSASRWSGIKPTSAWNKFNYRVGWLRPTTHTCRYEGSVDDEGRPSGWGEWIDDSYYGECLRGFWENGSPTGPFTTREYGSCFGFVNIRVGYVMCRSEGWKKKRLFPKPTPPKYGVASVECSVTGKFFREFPWVTMIMEPQPIGVEQIQSWIHHVFENMPSKLLPITKSVYVTLRDNNTIGVSGYEAPSQVEAQRVTIGTYANTRSPLSGAVSSNLNSSFAPAPSQGLKVNGWHNLQGTSTTAVLFIPGFNTTLKHSLQIFGQLLTLGQFPEYLKPFVFSYPAGRVITYFPTISTGACSELTTDAFLTTIQGLKQGGVTKLHIMAHSMGARCFMAALDKVMPEFSHCEDSYHDHGALKLQTLTFLNPDYPLRMFRTRFDDLRNICDMITLYGDKRDAALRWSEVLHGSFFSKEHASLGRNIFCLFKSVPNDQSESISINIADDDATSKNSESMSSLSESLSSMSTRPMNDIRQITATVAKSTQAVKDKVRGNPPAQPLADSPPTNGSGVATNRYKVRRGRRVSTEDVEFLDMDVIDTTLMESNVHSVRHNYFNLNSDIVDDLRDLIVNCRRAAHRDRIQKTEGNVYSFLVAPHCVVNT